MIVTKFRTHEDTLVTVEITMPLSKWADFFTQLSSHVHPSSEIKVTVEDMYDQLTKFQEKL